MKKIIIIMAAVFFLSSCMSLDYSEEQSLNFVLIENNNTNTVGKPQFSLELNHVEEKPLKIVHYGDYFLFNLPDEGTFITGKMIYKYSNRTVIFNPYYKIRSLYRGINIFDHKIVFRNWATPDFVLLTEEDKIKIDDIIKNNEDLKSLEINY